MVNKEVTMLIPQYMQQFTCTGSKCEDTCCKGWNIHIDKKTYKKYNKIRDPKFKKLMSARIKRNKGESSDFSYATIKLEENGDCPFLNTEKLCSIQMEYGGSYLSHTCNTYPRINNLVEQRAEQSASLSCPEAARLALLNPEKMAFDEISMNINEIGGFIKAKTKISENDTEKYFWDIRIFTIQLLQNRDYKISERLIVLGLFFESLQEMISATQSNKIPLLIQQFQLLISDKETLSKELGAVPVKNDIQMNIINDILMKKNGDISNKRFMECIDEFIQGINVENNNESIVTAYEEGYVNYYEPFMSKHGYILENYLVNYVFKELFPFGKEDGVYSAYVSLVVHFSLIKLLLIGMSNFHQGLNEEIIIKLIQSFGRTIEHSRTFINKVLDYLYTNKFDSMAYMSILIKN